MAEMNRQQLKEKIELTRTAIMFAGPIHRRDLQKHLHRMEVELRRYDRYQENARKGVT